MHNHHEHETSAESFQRALTTLRQELHSLRFVDDFEDTETARYYPNILTVNEIAARLGLTETILLRVIKTGDLPAPPEPRAPGDGFERRLERAWLAISPERRQALQDAAEEVVEDGDERISACRWRGVTQLTDHRFTAVISVGGKQRYLGSFGTVEEASAAYEAARAERDALNIPRKPRRRKDELH